ncbi:hypothetical protein Tco_0335038 [Tanacetum coccineum]
MRHVLDFSWCQCFFLASVMDTSLESPNIENLSVVREFADVFPDELPGLPPAREIEFGIELIPEEVGRRSFSNASFLVTASRFTLVILVSARRHQLMVHQRLKLSPKSRITYYGDGGEESFFWGLAANNRRFLVRVSSPDYALTSYPADEKGLRSLCGRMSVRIDFEELKLE